MATDERPEVTKQKKHWGHTVQYGHLGLDADENTEEEFMERVTEWWLNL